MGCSSLYACLQSHCPAFSSEHVDIGCNISKVYTFHLTPFCGRTNPSCGSRSAWHCCSVIHDAESIFLHERMRQETSEEGITWWVRQLSVALANISSLHWAHNFLRDKASFYSTWEFPSIWMSKSRFPFWFTAGNSDLQIKLSAFNC